ncbi:hypothetical protein ACHAW6_008050 [Cyclotella cf. meneghiniana]
MSICIESPPSAFVFSYNDKLSPPPTPGRKRLCLSKDLQEDVPLFFPKSKSIFGPEDNVSNDKAYDLFNLLSNSPPPPRLHLRPKSRFGTEMDEPRTLHSLTEVPPVPFSFQLQVTATFSRGDEPTTRRKIEDLVHLLPPPPLAGPASRSSPTFASRKMSEGVSDTVSAQSPPPRSKGSQKLPSIQRKGMDSRARKIDRRNSMVARCA